MATARRGSGYAVADSGNRTRLGSHDVTVQLWSPDYSASREAKLAEWKHMAVIAAFWGSAATSGLTSATTPRSAVLWCLSYFSLMLATMAFATLTGVGGQLTGEVQFSNYFRRAGRSLLLPWCLFWLGFVCLVITLIHMLHEIAGSFLTAWCVFACIGCMVGPLFCFGAWNRRAGALVSISGGHELDEIYAALREYVVVEKASLADVDREEFLQRFSVASREARVTKLAEIVFDDWKSKRIESMLRSHPGF